MYVSLYRKYRPSRFEDMFGQEHIKTVLRRQCEVGKVSHAYLFCGTRGTGKTTSAKILAKAVNCENPIEGEPCGKCAACLSIDSGSATDVLELDAASNNGVDDIRDICEQVIYPPASLKFRVYIIDEVHMLSAGAYNALLKTLEEPPQHVIFILATTELQKIPPTILSRCQRFEFRRIMPEDIKACLLSVASREGLTLEPQAACLLAELADGSMRDSLSLLESCVSASNGGAITKETVFNQLGIAQDDTVSGILKAAAAHDTLAALKLLEEYYNSAKSLGVLIENIVSSIRDILVFSQSGAGIGSLSRLNADDIRELSLSVPASELLYMAEVLEDTQTKLSRYPFNKRMLCEMMLIRLCNSKLSSSPQALLSRIAALESGAAVAAAAVPSAPRLVEKEKKAENAPTKEAPPTTPPEENIARFEPYEKLPELVEALRASGSICSMISQARVLTNGKKLTVIASPFMVTLLNNEKEISQLKSALRLTDGKDYDIVFTDETKLSTGKNLIDEL